MLNRGTRLAACGESQNGASEAEFCALLPTNGSDYGVFV
jgi:hypothetical protein